MDFVIIFVNVAVGCLLVVGRVSSYFNQSYGVYKFILSEDVRTDNNQDKTSLAYAQEWCRSSGYILATISNKEVQGYIKQFISSAMESQLIVYNDQIILNGKLNTSLPGTWQWVNGNQINGVEIKGQEDLSYKYFYGFLKTWDYKIYASTHSYQKPYICEYPGKANCEGGLVFNGRCYERNKTSLTWYSARNNCLEKGGDLASFETLNDTTFNSTLGSSLPSDASTSEYWVGMQRVEWRWEDTGLAIKYTNWESGSPYNINDGCLILRTTTVPPEWLWYNNFCSSVHRFICMAIIGTKLSTTSVATRDASSSKTASGSALSTTSSFSSPLSLAQPASNKSTSKPATDVLPLALGLGIGLGLGTLLIVVIVVTVIFATRRRQKSKSKTPEHTSSSNSEVRNNFTESASDASTADLDETKHIKANKEIAPSPNANSGAIYASVEPDGTAFSRTTDAETFGKQTVYAQFDLIQKP